MRRFSAGLNSSSPLLKQGALTGCKSNKAAPWGRPYLFVITLGGRSHSGSRTPHEVKDYGNYGKNQKNVDEESGDMKDEKSAQPQQQQDKSKT
jgi:hypothetical protein